MGVPPYDDAQGYTGPGALHVPRIMETTKNNKLSYVHDYAPESEDSDFYTVYNQADAAHRKGLDPLSWTSPIAFTVWTAKKALSNYMGWKPKRIRMPKHHKYSPAVSNYAGVASPAVAWLRGDTNTPVLIADKPWNEMGKRRGMDPDRAPKRHAYRKLFKEGGRTHGGFKKTPYHNVAAGFKDVHEMKGYINPGKVHYFIWI